MHKHITIWLSSIRYGLLASFTTPKYIQTSDFALSARANVERCLPPCFQRPKTADCAREAAPEGLLLRRYTIRIFETKQLAEIN